MTAWATAWNLTLRIAAINVASRNGGYLPEYIACGCVGRHGISVTNGSYMSTPWKQFLDAERPAGCRPGSRPACRRLRDVEGRHQRGGLQATDADNPPATGRLVTGDTWGAFERDVTAALHMPSMMCAAPRGLQCQPPEGATRHGRAGADVLSNWGATIDFAATPGAKIYAPLTSWYARPANPRMSQACRWLQPGPRDVAPGASGDECSVRRCAKKQASAPEN